MKFLFKNEKEEMKDKGENESIVGLQNAERWPQDPPSQIEKKIKHASKGNTQYDESVSSRLVSACIIPVSLGYKQ